MPRIADDEKSSPDEHGLSWLLKRHRARLAGLSATSAAGGVVEAVFLVAVTRAAFAITEGETTFPAVAGIEVGQRTFVISALVLILIRLGLAVASAAPIGSSDDQPWWPASEKTSQLRTSKRAGRRNTASGAAASRSCSPRSPTRA